MANGQLFQCQQRCKPLSQGNSACKFHKFLNFHRRGISKVRQRQPGIILIKTTAENAYTPRREISCASGTHSWHICDVAHGDVSGDQPCSDRLAAFHTKRRFMLSSLFPRGAIVVAAPSTHFLVVPAGESVFQERFEVYCDRNLPEGSR